MNLEQLQNLTEALRFYKQRGYHEIEAPWIVSKAAIAATIPPGARSMDVLDHGSLVASGEQSFVELWLESKLPNGKYCCCTPCFRDEPVISDLTRLYFTKVELIEVGELTFLKNTVTDAFDFHKYHIPNVKIVDTEIGFDIFSGNIELGSYGYRAFGKMSWVYGTGCAEPRFSFCKNILKRF